MTTTLRIALLVLSLTGSILAHGQAALLVLIFGDKAASENFHFTLDAGLNVAQLPGLQNSGMITDFYFGLGTYVKLNDQWAFTPEFKPLSPRGCSDAGAAFTDTTGTVGTSDTKFKLNYIDVPLQLHRRISDRFYVRAGPQVSFLTSASVATEGELTGGQAFTVDRDVKDQMNPVTFSLPMDLGVVFQKARGLKGIDLRLRYDLGLSEVFSSTQDLRSTNSTFQFFLSFPFVNVEP